MDDEEAARRYKSGFWSIGMSLSWMICRTAEAVMYAAKCDEPDAKGRFSPPSAYWALHIGSLEALRDPNARDPRLFADAQSAIDALVRAVLDRRVGIRSMSAAKVGFEGESRSAPGRYVAPPAEWSYVATIFHDRQYGYVIYTQDTIFGFDHIDQIIFNKINLSKYNNFLPSHGAAFWKDITLCSRTLRREFIGLSGPKSEVILNRRWQALRLFEHIIRHRPGLRIQYINCIFDENYCNSKSVYCKIVDKRKCIKGVFDTSKPLDAIAEEAAKATGCSPEMAGHLLRDCIDSAHRRGQEYSAEWARKRQPGRPVNKKGR